MALKNFLKKGKPIQPEKSAPPKALGLHDLFSIPIPLPDEVEEKLHQEFVEGKQLFNDFNRSRLQLAFHSFDSDMKHALYEVIFLLHVNEPFLSEWKYKAKQIIDYKEKEVEKTFDLFLDRAPSGVLGIEEISDVFGDDFSAYVQEVFGSRLLKSDENSAIVGLFSIGSIGTIGHKATASDLDLEVLYRLEPFNFEVSDISDEYLKEFLITEIKFWIKKIQVKEKITPDQAQQPETKARLQKEAREKTARLFPILYRHLITQQHLNIKMLLENDNPTLRTQLAKEIINLIKHITGVKSASIKKTKESLLKERIQLIQEYVNLKFPAAELYLFPFSEIDMKKGRFSSTLESKESSGSAYELILNYDTLMPGIYFTPVIPAHFIFHQDINNAPKTYGEIIDYIRFDLLNRIYGDLKHRMMDQGPTPDLDVDYVARHNGALYWEAFKATSGNLPKALLNLFRYESFLEEDTGKTVIQLIKNPGLLDDYIAGNPETDEIPVNSPFLPSWKLPDFELAFPELAFDPWWMRYKALKISYNEQANVSEIKKDELTEISAIIDLAFALHVRLSDVFTKPGSVKKMDSHREKVLSDFLKFAFPPDSARRKQLENIFVGEISEVNHFEETMRDLFKKLIQRVKKKIEQRLEGEVEKKEEFDIWYHYYQEHFEPKENTIKRTILKHLMVPRGRLQIGLMGKSGWFFKSLQKASGMGKRFDTFDILDQLPDQAVLFENTGFLSGLAHCIFNGYYGILDEGTLKERYTSLELDGKHMDLGNQSDNQFAFINPAQVEKMMLQILRLFPQKKVDHRDCLYEVRKIKELFIFINLLNFGKVSFLYRDNLNTVFFDEIENPSLHERAKQFNRSYFDFFHAPELHKTLSYFIQNQKIDLRDIKLKIWVNTNSFETNHVASNVAKKEDELQNEFFDCFLENHLKKQAAQTPPKGLPEIFDKQSLKLTLLCGIMLINFGSDAEKKYTVCRNLLHQSWKEDYGDPEAFYKRVLMDYDRFFISRADEYKRIDSFIQDLNFGLTSFQKEKFLGMIEEIIHADKKPIQKKLDLYKRIKQQISYF